MTPGTGWSTSTSGLISLNNINIVLCPGPTSSWSESSWLRWRAGAVVSSSTSPVTVRERPMLGWWSTLEQNSSGQELLKLWGKWLQSKIIFPNNILGKSWKAPEWEWSTFCQAGLIPRVLMILWQMTLPGLWWRTLVLIWMMWGNLEHVWTCRGRHQSHLSQVWIIGQTTLSQTLTVSARSRLAWSCSQEEQRQDAERRGCSWDSLVCGHQTWQCLHRGCSHSWQSSTSLKCFNCLKTRSGKNFDNLPSS